MAADANIFAQYLKPPRSVMDYQNEYQQADINRNLLAESNMGLAEKQRGVASENALARAISGGGDVAKQLADQGFGKQSIAYTKANQDALKQKAEIGHLDAQSGKLKADTTGAGLDQSIKAHDYHVQLLGAVSDPQSAQAWAVEGLKSGVFTPEQFARGFTNIPTDPAGFGQWKQQALQGGLTATEQLKQKQALEIAQATDATLRSNNANTNATSRLNNESSNATSRRGQDITAGSAAASRAQSAQQFGISQEAGKQQVIQTDNGPVLVNTRTGSGRVINGPDGQPLAGVTKPLNDNQSKALLFGTRMQEANRVLSTLAGEGTNASIPGSNAPIIGGAINAASSGNRQMLNQAKTDFMTAVLRRESGAAISSGEFVTADKQYFPQIGDSEKVIAQKARNRDLAIQGVLVEVPEKQRSSITPKSATSAKVVNFGDLK